MSLLRTRVAALATAGAVLIALSGCTTEPEPDPSPEPRPSESAAPIFASDDEALAAAVEAYEAFLQVSAEATSKNGADEGALEAVAEGAALEAQLLAVDELKQAGLYTVGQRSFAVYQLQSVEQSESATSVRVYVCDDLRPVDVLDSTGASAVSEGRVVDVPYVIDATGDEADQLVIASKELWEGDDYCA